MSHRTVLGWCVVLAVVLGASIATAAVADSDRDRHYFCIWPFCGWPNGSGDLRAISAQNGWVFQPNYNPMPFGMAAAAIFEGSTVVIHEGRYLTPFIVWTVDGKQVLMPVREQVQTGIKLFDENWTGPRQLGGSLVPHRLR